MKPFVLLTALALTAPPAFAYDAGYPVTDVNCGVTTTYEAVPDHAVTLSNNATEMLLALGLQDHMAGTSYMANLTISPQYAEAYAQIPILSPLVATTEQLLDAEADFVYAGYPDGFSEKRHSRDMLHGLGMKTRLNTEGCDLGQFGFDELYAEIRDVSAIFGVRDRGEALIASMQERLAEIDARLAGVEPIDVFIYNGGEAPPRAVLGHTMLTSVVERAGGRNVFADVEKRYGSVSWEQILERNPDYIVVFYSGTQSGMTADNPEADIAAPRIAVLRGTGIVADVTAIAEEHFVTISSVIGQPGPSSVDAVEKLARAFHPDRFAE